MNSYRVGSSFDDDGGDFLGEVIGSKGIGKVAEAIDAVPEFDGRYIDSIIAVRAVIAAELVAMLAGNGTGDEPMELFDWAADQNEIDWSLVHRAHDCMKVVLRNSDICEAWNKSFSSAKWRQRIEEAMIRLEHC
jgi:hypothetical protein